MTREENQRCAINYLIELKKSTKGYSATWLDLAIKALEQTDVLDKIRAEIETMSGDIETIADVLEIIDKYKI